MFSLTELQDLGHAIRGMSTSYENALWDNLDQCIIDKVVGE